MKYTGGKSRRDPVTGEWISNPRVYTDFHCSLKEWKNLNRGKKNLVNQAMKSLVYQQVIKNPIYSTDINGKFYLFFDKDIDGDYSKSDYSSSIIKEVIKLVTGLSCNVEFYSWKQSVDHIEIEVIGGEKRLPNIVVLFDIFELSEEETIIKCLDAVYSTLNCLKYNSFNVYYRPYFNNNYDFIFNNCPRESWGPYGGGKYSEWPAFRPKSDRFFISESSISYDALNNKSSIEYSRLM